jgi:DNA-binding transcriptional LysR family regulator
MFGKLFAESGLSLDRLRVLIEVGAGGSIVRAAAGDPAKQSQYSRQLKELEDFFQTPLVERQGKNLRLTANGKELARISRFFLLGLSNFQCGCLAEGQTYRIGASSTFNQTFLLPILAAPDTTNAGVHFTIKSLDDHEIERRLHDLTLDFGFVTRTALSRPLQLRQLGTWQLKLWVPKALCPSERAAAKALLKNQLPFVWPSAELDQRSLPGWEKRQPSLGCETFLEACRVTARKQFAALLPEFLSPGGASDDYFQMRPTPKLPPLHCSLAWNPRLMRLNPHAARRRDALAQRVSQRLQAVN